MSATALRADPDFRRFVLARTISLAGTSVTYVALPVMVYQLSGSPLLTALVAAFEALPYLLLGLPAGALADRFDRRRLMVTTDLLNAVALASVPLAWAFDRLTVPHLLVLAFVVPALFVLFDAAEFGAVPTLVGRERIAAANSAIWASGTVVELVVPLLTGALLAVVDGAFLLSVDALSYVASALLVRMIARPLSQSSGEPRERLRWPALVADVREGLDFLWGHTRVRAATAVGAAQAVGGGAFVGQMVVWADRELGVVAGDVRLGVLFGAWGVGTLAATAVVPRLASRVGTARVVVAAVPVSAVCAVLTALAATWWLGALALTAWGASYMLVVINGITYRQQETPVPLMSRVNTTGRMLSFGLGWPLGSLLGGVVAEAAGPRAGMLAGAVAVGVAAVIAWTSPLRTTPVAAVPAQAAS